MMSYTVDFAPVCIWLEADQAKKSGLIYRNQQLMIQMGRQNECKMPGKASCFSSLSNDSFRV